MPAAGSIKKESQARLRAVREAVQVHLAGTTSADGHTRAGIWAGVGSRLQEAYPKLNADMVARDVQAMLYYAPGKAPKTSVKKQVEPKCFLTTGAKYQAHYVCVLQGIPEHLRTKLQENAAGIASLAQLEADLPKAYTALTEAVVPLQNTPADGAGGSAAQGTRWDRSSQ